MQVVHSEVKDNQFINNDNEFYYFNEEDIMKKGWINLNNKCYYAESSGEMKIDWLKYNNKWYYLYDNGEMARFEFINKKYYGKYGVLKDLEKKRQAYNSIRSRT